MWILFLVSGTGISQVKTEEITENRKKSCSTNSNLKLDFTAFDFCCREKKIAKW